jgi:hypothetical protein
MRHPHGLRAAAGNQGIVLPAIGAAFEGGFFAGAISHTANGVATHLLIVAPSASGYNGKTRLDWKTSNTSTAGTSSTFDGAANSANMNDASHPAAEYCEGLTIGGYSDWYLPARDELDIAYENLKPDTTSNDTSLGVNAYSVPERTVNRTAGAPAQTTAAAFQTGGAEEFVTDNYHLTSTEVSATTMRMLFFSDGSQVSGNKVGLRYVRAFRKVAV